MKTGYLLFIAFYHIMLVHGKPKSVDGFVQKGGKLTVEENYQLQKSCGHYSGPRTKSFGSFRSKRTEAPWVVGMAYIHENGNLTQTKQFCSASLISDRHVLTAWHCLALPDKVEILSVYGPQEMFIESGTTFDKFLFVFDDDCSASITPSKCSIKNAIVRKAVKVVSPKIFPTKFKPGTMDIAIFELDEPVASGEDLYPVCLSETHPEIEDILDLYSYGMDDRNINTLEGSLQHISVTNLPCHKYVGKDTICVRSDKQDTKQGDSGGAFVYMKDNITYVTGVVSGGGPITNNVSENREVSIAHHLRWICAHTGICVYEKKTEQIHTFIDTITPYE